MSHERPPLTWTASSKFEYESQSDRWHPWHGKVGRTSKPGHQLQTTLVGGTVCFVLCGTNRYILSFLFQQALGIRGCSLLNLKCSNELLWILSVKKASLIAHRSPHEENLSPGAHAVRVPTVTWHAKPNRWQRALWISNEEQVIESNQNNRPVNLSAQVQDVNKDYLRAIRTLHFIGFTCHTAFWVNK